MNVNKSVYFSLHTTCQCTKIWSCSNSGFVQEALLTNMECSCKTPKWMFWFWFFKDHWQLHLQRSRWERRPPRGRERRPWGRSRGGPRGRPGGCCVTQLYTEYKLSSSIFCCLWASMSGIGNTRPNLHFFQYIQAYKPYADPVPCNTKQCQFLLTQYHQVPDSIALYWPSTCWYHL